MTQHDQISSFIDNELSTDQEQDFLISLASSEGLRKSFRSELVLKNIIHRDDVLTSPSRDMRPAVLACVGIAAATVGAAETAEAATSSAATAAKSSLLKTLFATKLNAVVTASMIALSAAGGYEVHSIVTSTTTHEPAQIHRALTTEPTQTAPKELQTPASATTTTPADLGSAPATIHAATATPAAAKKHETSVTKTQEQTKPINVIGNGTVHLTPPKIKK